MFLILSIFKILILVYGSYGADLLAKFHQSDYMIKNTRCDVEYVNHTLMYHFNMVGHKYNRTTTAFNSTFRPKVDFENKLEVLTQGYKKASNEYRLFPVRLQLNLCKVINANVAGLKSLPKYGNFPTCYWKKNITYFSNNFLVDETQFPPYIPYGEYNFQATLLLVEDKLAVVNVYAEIFGPEIVNYNKNG